MAAIRISLAQINTIVGDIAGNSKRIVNYIKKAKNLRSDIVVFPELTLSGYPPEDLLLKPHFNQKNIHYLTQIKEATDSILAIVGLPLPEQASLFNACAFLYNKKILGFYRKICLPNYGVFDEMRYFKPGGKIVILDFTEDIKIGVNICEDIWVADGPDKYQSTQGQANIIINISASPYHAQKLHERERLLSQRAKEDAAFVVYCNLVGGQDELVFDGASMAFATDGSLIARARQFEEDLLTFDLDCATSRLKLKPAGLKPELSLEHIRTSHVLRKRAAVKNRIEKPFSPIEEIYSALMLGLRDYVYKNGFKQVILGLSGGIDSAAAATIAVDALGKNNVKAISMPSAYSSEGTKADALKLAKSLGIELHVLPIDNILKHYLTLLRRPFGNKKRDITEENLQARIRGTILMAFSNKFNYLVVTTGNKSELSTGYCTLYGDTAGGFALLKDVPKMMVYKLCRFRNEKAGKKLIPESIFERVPTAELKKDQTDQDTLPAYPVLDEIIDEYIEKDNSAAEIIKKGFEKTLVRRVVAMIDRSEYKRRQYAVGVKITPKSFGRDRRMPITNRFVE
jgi:NAD+ synthase (glutamine-hydrolysing)